MAKSLPPSRCTFGSEKYGKAKLEGKEQEMEGRVFGKKSEIKPKKHKKHIFCPLATISVCPHRLLGLGLVQCKSLNVSLSSELFHIGPIVIKQFTEATGAYVHVLQRESLNSNTLLRTTGVLLQ